MLRKRNCSMKLKRLFRLHGRFSGRLLFSVWAYNATRVHFFQRLLEASLFLNFEKRKFLQPQVSFLGHNITSDRDLVQAIASFSLTKTVKALRTFLIMLNFYHRFMPRTAHRHSILNYLTDPKTKEPDWLSGRQRLCRHLSQPSHASGIWVDRLLKRFNRPPPHKPNFFSNIRRWRP